MGCPVQFLCGSGVVRKGRHPSAGGALFLRAGGDDRRSEILRDRARSHRIRCRKDHRELAPAEPRGHVPGPESRTDPARAIARLPTGWPWRSITASARLLRLSIAQRVLDRDRGVIGESLHES